MLFEYVFPVVMHVFLVVAEFVLDLLILVSFFLVGKIVFKY